MPRPCPSPLEADRCERAAPCHCANDGSNVVRRRPRSDHAAGLRTPVVPLHDGRHAPTCPAAAVQRAGLHAVRGLVGSPLRPWQAALKHLTSLTARVLRSHFCQTPVRALGKLERMKSALGSRPVGRLGAFPHWLRLALPPVPTLPGGIPAGMTPTSWPSCCSRTQLGS